LALHVHCVQRSDSLVEFMCSEAWVILHEVLGFVAARARENPLGRWIFFRLNMTPPNILQIPLEWLHCFLVVFAGSDRTQLELLSRGKVSLLQLFVSHDDHVPQDCHPLTDWLFLELGVGGIIIEELAQTNFEIEGLLVIIRLCWGVKYSLLAFHLGWFTDINLLELVHFLSATVHFLALGKRLATVCWLVELLLIVALGYFACSANQR